MRKGVGCFAKSAERELTKFDASQPGVVKLNRLRDENQSTYRGGEDTIPVTPACPEGRL